MTTDGPCIGFIIHMTPSLNPWRISPIPGRSILDAIALGKIVTVSMFALIPIAGMSNAAFMRDDLCAFHASALVSFAQRAMRSLAGGSACALATEETTGTRTTAASTRTTRGVRSETVNIRDLRECG